MELNKRKDWRKALKKCQRKRRRQKCAQERDRLELENEVQRLKDPAYCKWLKQQEELELTKQKAEEIRKQKEEEAWLKSEQYQQHLCSLAQKRRLAEEAAQEEARVQQEKERSEREAQQIQREMEEKRQLVEAKNLFDKTMDQMENFLDDSNTLIIPAELRCCVDSRPGVKLCPFFERTNCCRFEMQCQFNHRRPLLSRIVMMRNFFIHSSIEQQKTPVSKLNGEVDLNADYEAFFEDVATELEKHGQIVHFCTTQNVQKHLRGHVLVEYKNEKSALNAFINLQGRYYDGNRLNVEFSSLQQWCRAICGLSLARKCLKGSHSSFNYTTESKIGSVKSSVFNSWLRICNPYENAYITVVRM